MARLDPTRTGITETAQDARGAENSKNSFGVLTISMTLAVMAGIALFWYFSISPLEHAAAPTGL